MIILLLCWTFTIQQAHKWAEFACLAALVEKPFKINLKGRILDSANFLLDCPNLYAICGFFPRFTSLCQDVEWLEYFAGTGNLTRVMTAAQYKSFRFDILDNNRPANRRSNFMDLTEASGFALLSWKFHMIINIKLYHKNTLFALSTKWIIETWLYNIIYTLVGIRMATQVGNTMAVTCSGR